jgi:hypothetical protein
MSAENPENEQSETDEPSENDESNQDDALKQAILKLQEQGLLTHVPDELINEQQQEPESHIKPDDATFASRPPVDSPTIAPSSDAASDDIEEGAAKRVQWSAVSSAWDDVSAREEKQDEDEVIIESILETRESQQIKTISEDEEKSITLKRKEIKPQSEDALTGSRDETPWTLQQFFDGEIDLDKELSKRFPIMPPMTTIKFRTLGSRSGRKVATLTTQDANASVIFDADVETKVVQMSFSYGSMLTLRFALSSLNDSDRLRWLELMRREQGGLAFLWGPARWNEDYLICIARKYSTNIYAFSPNNFDAAIRMTNSVTEELLNWLEEIWTAEPEPKDDDDSPLLTW